MKKMPKKILVHVGDRDKDGHEYLYVATSLDEIEEDYNGALVGEYQLVATKRLKIIRQLK